VITLLRRYLSKRTMKAKKKVNEALKVAEFWLPYLNDFALNSVDKPYEHPWIPVEVLRKIITILDDEDK
jgi:hypothetical protein